MIDTWVSYYGFVDFYDNAIPTASIPQQLLHFINRATAPNRDQSRLWYTL